MNLRKNLKSIKVGLVLAGLVLGMGAGMNANATDELITNGGFESGNNGDWGLSGAVITSGSFPHWGSYYAVLGEINGGQDLLSQVMTVPSGADSATISFYFNIYSDEATTQAYDKLDVTLENLTTGESYPIRNLSNLNKHSCAGGSCYELSTKQINLSGKDGNSVQIKFHSDLDDTVFTSFKIDDVSIKVTIVDEPAPTTPDAITNKATNIGETSAQINGTVDPNNVSTNSFFEWGKTTNTLSITSFRSVGSEDSPVAMSETITGLDSNTQYMFRMRGYRPDLSGVDIGAWKYFTTDYDTSVDQCSDFDFSEITTIEEAESLIYEKCSNNNLRIVGAIIQEINSDYIDIKTYRAGEGTTSIVTEKKINITSNTPVFETTVSLDSHSHESVTTKKTIASLEIGDFTVIECEEDESMEDAEEFTAILITKDVFIEDFSFNNLQAIYNPITQNVALQWSWDGPLSEIDGFRIYRKISEGVVQEIGETSNSYFYDNNVSANTRITYYIKAYLGEGGLDYIGGGEVEVYTDEIVRDAPGVFNLFLDEMYCGTNGPAIKINWEASTNVSSYQVDKASDSSPAFGFYENVDNTLLNFTDEADLIAGNTYYYLIRGINEFGVTISNHVEAKILEDICDNNPYCGDGIKNADEECDGGEGCTDQCLLVEDEQNTPPTLFSSEQFYENSDGETYVINEGEKIHSTNVVLVVFAEDTDADPYKIEFEIRPAQEAFTGNGDAVYASNFISYSGSVHMPVTVEEGGYHWRVRAIDIQGATTDWIEFGTVGNIDFTVQIEEDLLKTVNARDVSYFFQELQSDNTRILPEQTNPENIIDDDKLNFVSLGLGGEIILRLEHGVYPSALVIGEAEKQIGTIESAQLFVSEDGSTWIEAGNVQNGSENTNSNSELILQMPQFNTCVHYIKIIDMTTGSDINGFDLMGVKVNYQQGRTCGNTFDSRLPITYSTIDDENIDEGDRVFVKGQGDYASSYLWDWNGDGIVDEITNDSSVFHAWSFDCSNDGEVKYALTKIENGIKSTYATKINVNCSFFNRFHSCKNQDNQWVDEDLLKASPELLLSVDKMMRDIDGDGEPDVDSEELDWITFDSEIYGSLTREDYLSLLLRPMYFSDIDKVAEITYLEYLYTAMQEEAYMHEVVAYAKNPSFIDVAVSIVDVITPDALDFVVGVAGLIVPGVNSLIAFNTLKGIPSLDSNFYEESGGDEALQVYLVDRGIHEYSHEEAWFNMLVQKFVNKSIEDVDEDDKILVRSTLNQYFSDLYESYGDGIELGQKSNPGGIKPDFRKQIRENIDTNVIANIPYYLNTLADRTILLAHSPIDVVIIDAYGNKTGYLNGVNYSDVSNSLVSIEKERIEILGVDDETVINILGTDVGVYSMEIWQLSEGVPKIYKLTNIPTKPQTIHMLTIEWSDMITNEVSATMAIDQDGDGEFEQTITTGSEFNGGDLIASAKNLKEQTVENLNSVKTGKYAVDGKIKNVVKEITNTLRDAYWQDGNHLDSERGSQVFYSELRAVKLLNSYLQRSERILRYRLPVEVSDAFYQAIDDLVEADDILAQTALDEAKNMTVNNQQNQRKYDQAITNAEARIERARDYAQKYKEYGTPKRIEYAVNYYKQAWDYAKDAAEWAEF